MSTPGRTKSCYPKVSKSRTAEPFPHGTIAPGSPEQPRRVPTRVDGSSRSNSCWGPPGSLGWIPPELPPGAAPPPPSRNVLEPERLLSRSASLSMPSSPSASGIRVRRTRPSTIFDTLSETPSIPELDDPRRSSLPPRYSQVINPSSRRTPREKSSWRPSDSRSSDSLYDSSEADARVPKNDIPERWERPFVEINTDQDMLDPVLEVTAEPEPVGDGGLSGSALASFLASERRRDLSLVDPFSELAGRATSPRSPRVSSPKSPRINTPRLPSPPQFEQTEAVRPRAISSPHITFRSSEPEQRPAAGRRRPKYARHAWRPSQAAPGDHLYEPPALDDDMPARWERPFDLHDELELDVPKPKPRARPEPEPEQAPIDTTAINSFLANERRRDMGSTAWANQLQTSMGDSIRADPQTAAVLTRVATIGRERGRHPRRGHSRNESWDGSALLGSNHVERSSEVSRPSLQATIRAVLDPIPGAVPDCTADGREARRHARRVRQGREDHEDAPPAYMPDRPPVYVEGGTRA